jgi:ribosome-binding factor A
MTFRQQRINKQVQKDLAEIIRTQGMTHYDGAMVSVTEVDVSPNMLSAKVYVSIFPSSKSSSVLPLLNAKTLRMALAQRVRKQMRCVPELTFVLDTTLDYAERIDELLQAGNNG